MDAMRLHQNISYREGMIMESRRKRKLQELYDLESEYGYYSGSSFVDGYY
jgi:hypothetical protein